MISAVAHRQEAASVFPSDDEIAIKIGPSIFKDDYKAMKYNSQTKGSPLKSMCGDGGVDCNHNGHVAQLDAMPDPLPAEKLQQARASAGNNHVKMLWNNFPELFGQQRPESLNYSAVEISTATRDTLL